MKLKKILKIGMLMINTLIIMYLPMLNASGINTLGFTLISGAIFIYFLVELVKYMKNKRELLANSLFILGSFVLPVILFLLVFQFGY
ncbi:hypothetical protein DFR54_105134 [Vagococcus fluvialis]|uniref:Uncharacterized protein n=2 Tax=Vagococcus fluvialis TaxID=2738 RepID=A0A369B1Y8_9ENTE|nr:hypothetical protein [Vagococcus fluvialis]RCX13724.1 hypothetical protein DFR54_105134 [Vagococcus fluvialis]RSU02305.1 hypothetical protein CBF32_06890 [Vagococcus fluvialis]WNF90752.1 hypothetical protein QDW48_03300 [Vagococcus fluvialis]